MNTIITILCIIGGFVLLLSLLPKNSNFLDIRSIFAQHFKVFRGNWLQFFSIFIVPILFATVYKGNIIKNLIMDCQSYTKYRPNETTGGIFVSWRRKEELPTGA